MLFDASIVVSGRGPSFRSHWQQQQQFIDCNRMLPWTAKRAARGRFGDRDCVVVVSEHNNGPLASCSSFRRRRDGAPWTCARQANPNRSIEPSSHSHRSTNPQLHMHRPSSSLALRCGGAAPFQRRPTRAAPPAAADPLLTTRTRSTSPPPPSSADAMAPHGRRQQQQQQHGAAGHKRPRPPQWRRQQQQQEEPPHFVHTLFPGTAPLEAYLTPYVLACSLACLLV